MYEIRENITLEELDFEPVRMRVIDCFNSGAGGSKIALVLGVQLMINNGTSEIYWSIILFNCCAHWNEGKKQTGNVTVVNFKNTWKQLF